MKLDVTATESAPHENKCELSYEPGPPLAEPSACLPLSRWLDELNEPFPSLTDLLNERWLFAEIGSFTPRCTDVFSTS